MAAYTVKVLYTCCNNEHIHLQVYKDDVAFRKITVNRSDVLGVDLDLDTMLLPMIKAALKTSGASTLAQAKIAIENMVITL